jgi:hypothetical protein
MARRYSQVNTSIWQDEDFRQLSESAQLAYLKLITQPDITPVGTLPLTLRRWAASTAGLAIDCLSIALTELENGLFVVVDHDREELLVRSFVKWDAGSANSKRLTAIKSAAASVGSPILRGVVAFELNKVGIDHIIQELPIDSQSIGNRLPIDCPVIVVTLGGKNPQQAITNNQPATHTPQPATPSDDSLGGDRHLSGRAGDATGPRPKCSTHPDGDHDGPCGGCKRVREYDTAIAEQQKRAEQDRRANCPDCHGEGWITDDAGNPTKRCSHRRAA